MNGIRLELLEKKAEIDTMSSMIDDASSSHGGVVRSAILKSAYVLMLYNAIESTISLTLERIHDEVSALHYAELSSQLKAIWVEFFFTKHSEKMHRFHLDGTLDRKISFPPLNQFNDRIRLFSGNLDARKLNQLLGKYGIGSLSTPDREKLLVIKNKRNAISHGELSFKEACRNITSGELLSLRNATFSALDSIVNQVEIYLTLKRFRTK